MTDEEEEVNGRRISTVRYGIRSIVPSIDHVKMLQNVVERVNIILLKGQTFLEYAFRRLLADGKNFPLTERLVGNCFTLFYGAHPTKDNDAALFIQNTYLNDYQALCNRANGEEWGRIVDGNGLYWQSIQYAYQNYYRVLLRNYDSVQTWRAHLAIYFRAVGLSRNRKEAL